MRPLLLKPTGLSGQVIFAEPSNALQINSKLVAFIDCDEYPGEIQAAQVLQAAWQAKATAIVFYSPFSDWCNLQEYSGSDPWVYTMKNKTDTWRVIDAAQKADNGAIWATIGPASLKNVNSTGSGGVSGSDNSGRHLPPATPSTAVAMIILYSITGIITALFLVIIITGALRAHRHPERYGPRNIVGRPRQSRARGLARAIVETLPVVKFGEREEPKPTDVELGATSETANATTTTADHQVTNDRSIDQPQETTRDSNTAEEGIRAAVVDQHQHAVATLRPDDLGCSICTEDFQTGEDQRVLPCDHRFHPACIDPWLLNVSGTCPLCRIDLRPQNSNTDTGEVDENGNPILREPDMDNLSPPLDSDNAVNQQHRMGIRRSIIAGIRGLSGPPPPLSPEERAAAYQRWRAQSAAARHRLELERERTEAAPRPAEEERSRRQRLRRAFGIRTRRTGQGEVRDEADENATGAAEDSTDAHS